MKILFKCSLFLFCLFGFIHSSYSQVSDSLYTEYKVINQLTLQLHGDSLQANRIIASDSLRTKWIEILNNPISYRFNFDSIRGISVLKSPDNKFKLISWELYVDSNQYRHFGFIQKENGNYYELFDKTDELDRIEFLRLKAENWYGILYYKIVPIKYNGDSYYILLGRDSYQYFERRKIIEILSFESSGKPKFGANILEVKDNRNRMVKVCRYVLQYSAAASVLLRYDEELKMIVFDHLVMGGPLYSGGPPLNIPDGSFSGLKFEKNKWNYIDMVFEYDYNNTLEQAFNPSQIMSNPIKSRDEGKDIFGRDRNPSKKGNQKNKNK